MFLTNYFVDTILYQIFKGTLSKFEFVVEGEDGPFKFNTAFVSTFIGTPLQRHGWDGKAAWPCKAIVSIVAPAPRVKFLEDKANFGTFIKMDFMCQGFLADEDHTTFHQVANIFYDAEILARLSIDKDVTLKMQLDDLKLNYTTYNESNIGEIGSNMVFDEFWEQLLLSIRDGINDDIKEGWSLYEDLQNLLHMEFLDFRDFNLVCKKDYAHI